MKCPKCGREIDNDSIYCEYCGVKLDEVQGRIPIWIMLAVLSVLCMLGGLGIVYNRGNHSQPADEMTDTLGVVSDTIRLDSKNRDKSKDQEKQQQEPPKSLVREVGETETTIQPEESKVSKGYVDLGLPSGTLWKDKNERGGYKNFFTYEQAVNQFGSKLPTKEQLQELIDECNWIWTASGYKVTGHNGNYIVLPAAGCRDCNGSVYDVGSYGLYWSSTSDSSEEAWLLNFHSDGVGMDGNDRCFGQSVRLVQD